MNPFGGLALVLGLFCWLALDFYPQGRGLDGRAARLKWSAFLGAMAAIGCGFGLHAVRKPGGRIWIGWLSLLVNCGLLLVVFVRIVRYL